MEALAARAEVPRFTTHTFRHLCLTDLARAGWPIADIAAFAGHRSTDTTLIYIRLSGRELSKRFAATIHSVHERRTALLSRAFAT